MKACGGGSGGVKISMAANFMVSADHIQKIQFKLLYISCMRLFNNTNNNDNRVYYIQKRMKNKF